MPNGLRGGRWRVWHWPAAAWYFTIKCLRFSAQSAEKRKQAMKSTALPKAYTPTA
jgi:hypothetical protein